MLACWLVVFNLSAGIHAEFGMPVSACRACFVGCMLCVRCACKCMRLCVGSSEGSTVLKIPWLVE